MDRPYRRIFKTKADIFDKDMLLFLLCFLMIAALWLCFRKCTIKRRTPLTGRGTLSKKWPSPPTDPELSEVDKN